MYLPGFGIVKDLNNTVANVAMTCPVISLDFCRTVVIRSFIRSLWQKTTVYWFVFYILALGCVL
jgi:hypothetical protein